MGFGRSHSNKHKLIRRVRFATREAQPDLAHSEGKNPHDAPGHNFDPRAGGCVSILGLEPILPPSPWAIGVVDIFVVDLSLIIMESLNRNHYE
jgi:hypothetical protein